VPCVAEDDFSALMIAAANPYFTSLFPVERLTIQAMLCDKRIQHIPARHTL
jgi:hypothetical protein